MRRLFLEKRCSFKKKFEIRRINLSRQTGQTDWTDTHTDRQTGQTDWTDTQTDTHTDRLDRQTGQTDWTDTQTHTQTDWTDRLDRLF